jgi:hypothetical protein
VRRGGEYGLLWAQTSFAAFGSRLSPLAVVVALFAQTLAFSAHFGSSGADAAAAAAALSQIVGSSGVLCVQSDGDTHDSSACPLCQLAGQTLALTAPDAPSEPAPPPTPSAEPRLHLETSFGPRAWRGGCVRPCERNG